MASIRHFEGECNCADRMLTDCGCVAHVYSDGSGVDMQWCEQHSSHAPGHQSNTGRKVLSLIRSAYSVALVAQETPDMADIKSTVGEAIDLLAALVEPGVVGEGGEG